MKNFNHALSTDHTYHKLERSLAKGVSPQLLVGLSASQKAHFIYSLTVNLETPSLVILPDEASAVKMQEDINNFLGYSGALVFPARELTLYETEGVSREYEQARIGILSHILFEKPPIVLASLEAASLFTIPPDVLKTFTKTLKAGETHPPEELTKFLVGAGYTRESQVDGISQFAVRGGILDIFPASRREPYRIEFWGDEIDTISTFDIASQRRLNGVESVQITPVRESLIESQKKLILTLSKAMEKLGGKYGKLAKANIASDIERLENGLELSSADKYLPLIYPSPSTLFDYCSDRLLFVSDAVGVRENAKNFWLQKNEDTKILLEEGVLFKGVDTFYADFSDFELTLKNSTTTIMETFNRTLPDFALAGMHSISAIQLSPWSGSFDILKEDLDGLIREKYGIIVFAGTQRSCDGLLSTLLDNGFKASYSDSFRAIPKGEVIVTTGGLSSGMKYAEIGLAVITHVRTGADSKKRKARHKSGKKLKELSDLNIGDNVVHVSHGIGVFRGIVKRNIHGITKDYIEIRYAGSDALFIPVTQLDLVSKYIGGGGEGKKVKLNRLNSADWQKTRSRVKGAVKEMAKELIALYSKRMHTPGYAFSADSDWQREFEQKFPYEETDDQLQAVEDIKRDMEKPIPMDRLLCGDVGFGKTEVALRGIFKCVLDGKQAAILVPTTILAWQHYQTFTKRLDGYPIKIELLSRFRTPKQQKEILKQLKNGDIDIIIGTHRLVQKDIEFKNLGLCVIDEEQRFGVAHKEKFKEFLASVDILTLTATPIPRTLNMAMSGIRDMSLIEDPPQDRHPVQTYVLEYQRGIIVQALEKELRRGGQVFYLHNNTNTINRCAAKLQEDLPDARIMVAHGRMGEETLSDIWSKLVEQEIDILVCTTIIETGVDVPNANTLVVENAENYGLAQLYQLRGRVGRSSRRAYAYLTFQRGKALSDIATKRLTAIREFTTFGSGFQIAMQDLEIRGAGNILGASQHGQMEAVGYDMYIKLLNEAVKAESGEPVPTTNQCTIDINLNAYIPEEYISNSNQRIDAYKKISSIETEADVLDVTDELIDRYGDPPDSVAGLIDVAFVRGSASKLGISEIKQIGTKIIFYPQNFDLTQASLVASAMQGRVLINAGDRPYYSVQVSKGSGPLEAVSETLAEMYNAAQG